MYVSHKTLVLLGFTLVVGIVFGLVLASQMQHSPTAHTRQAAGSNFAFETRSPVVTAPADLRATAKAFVGVAKQAIPAVVSITSERLGQEKGDIREFFHNWWQRDPEGEERYEPRQQGLGSGVIISADGYIITNNHVIDEADRVYAWIDAERYRAEVVGTDPSTDLAVIRIDAGNTELPVIQIGDSDSLEVGEWVIAVGNPFSLRLQHTVTAGIVSGIGRADVGIGDIEYENYIQTDAAINPGNSGGALVNMMGQLVGINTAIYSRGPISGNVGIGFAIPVNLVKYVTKELIDHGRVVRGWLGVSIRSVETRQLATALGLPEPRGAIVTGLQQGPAKEAGIEEQDVIVEFAGIEVADHNHLMNLVAKHKPGEKVQLRFIRNGEARETEVRLGERPALRQLLSGRAPEPLEAGFTVEEVSPELARKYGYESELGVIVTHVQQGSIAETEGMMVGDLILSLNKIKIRSVRQFREQMQIAKREGFALIRLQRQQNKYFIALNLRDE